jgi:hypothetical protein
LTQLCIPTETDWECITDHAPLSSRHQSIDTMIGTTPFLLRIDNPDVTLPETDLEVRIPDTKVPSAIPATTRSYRDVLVHS